MKNVVDIPNCADCTNKNSVFCCLPPEKKALLSLNKSNNFIKKGRVIFHEDNYPHGLYCIHKGKVKISKLGHEGKEQIVRFAGSGELLGYRAVFGNESYKATATAMEDCYICHLSFDSFNTILNENNNLSGEVIKLLSSDLRNSEQKLISISQKSVKKRIAETLLQIQIRFGFEEDGKTLGATLTRMEIGDIAGTTTESTIRTLSTLKKEGVINLIGRKIEIIELKKLINISTLID